VETERSAYLDYSATTPVDRRVIDAMMPYWMEGWGNPNSLYRQGRDAFRALEAARESFAAGLGAGDPAEVIFTGCGTESDNAAVLGIARSGAAKGKGRHVVVSAIEHKGILEPAKLLSKQGFEVTYLKPREDGVVYPDDLRAVVSDDTVLVSIMHVNNEIGTIAPIAELAAVTHEVGGYFHTDAVQSVGKVPFDAAALGVDAAAFSGHKIYGPKGVGAMYLKRGTPFEPLLIGGGQENKKRSGTQNVAGAVGLAKALELMLVDLPGETARLRALRDRVVEGITSSMPNTMVNGTMAEASHAPHIANVVIKGVEGESMLLQLDNRGIAVSTGSACSSGSLEPSHVLLAIGCPPELAHGSLRISLGRFTTAEEVEYLIEVLPPIVERLRAMSPVYAKMFGDQA
jgi:cysteine desulfurase